MDPSEEKTPGDPLWITVILVLGAVIGILFASIWIDRNEHLFRLAIYLGGGLAVLAGGPGLAIRNPVRYALLLLGGFGLGLLLRGFAEMT